LFKRRNIIGQGLVIRRLVLSFLLLQVACVAAFAGSLPPIGQRVQGSIDLLGKPIPLPPGEWRVAAAGFGQAAEAEPGPYGAIGGVLLVRPDPDQNQFLLIHTNALPVRAGWGEPPECVADGALFKRVAEQRDLHNGCSYVIAMRRSRLLQSGLPALGNGETAALIEALPSWALVAGFRVSDRHDVLDMRYGVAPRRPSPGGWFAANAAENPAHQLAINELAQWTQTAMLSATAALRDPVGQVPPMPLSQIASGSRLARPADKEVSTLRLSLYKMATYRVTNSALTMVLALAFTGNVFAAAELTFWQGLTHSMVYLGNELAWEWPSATPVTPFVGGRPAASSPMASAHPPVMVAAAGKDLPLPAHAFAAARPANPAFAVDGKQVPLPEGDWTVLASEHTAAATGTLLGRIEDAHLLGLAIIHTNPSRTVAIFGTSPDCLRRDLAFAVVRYDTPEDGYCTYGKQVMLGGPPEQNPLWAKAREKLAADGVKVPQAMMMAGARARTRENFLDARYYFAPMQAGRDDAWMTPDPVAALQAWADLAQRGLELGVRGRLPAADAELPSPWERNAVRSGLIEQAHLPLVELAAEGALDDASLKQQLAAADVALVEREQQRWSLWTRSGYKVATYKVASWVDALAVSWLVTGSATQTLGISVAGSAIRPLLAYANEIGWANSGIGKPPASLVPVGFPEIGRDRPAE
jgi:uncharacterized membrane protein